MKFSATVTLDLSTPFSWFSPEDWKKGLDWMRDSRLDGAELCICNYNGVDVYAVREELDKRGLGCSTLSTGAARTREGISLTGYGDDACRGAQKRLCEHIDAAAILGSKVTIGLLRGLGTAETRDQDLRMLREAMLPIADYAQKKGVVVVLEAINRYETALLNSAEATLDFIRNMLGDPDSVGVLWDLFHANIEDDDFFKTADLLGNKLKHLHIADSNRQFPGFGHTDMDSIFRRLKAAGYQEYASFECLSLPTPETALHRTAAWVEHIRKLEF